MFASDESAISKAAPDDDGWTPHAAHSVSGDRDLLHADFPDATLHGRCVLVVEDDVAVAQMYKLKLEVEGYLVLTAADAETGLLTAEKFQPDLIILDIGLPGMNGLALLDTVRASDRLCVRSRS